MEYTNLKEIFDKSNELNKPVYKVVIEDQADMTSLSEQELYDKMSVAYNTMISSIEEGLNKKSQLKIEQQDSAKIYKKYVDNGKSIFGKNLGLVVARALAVAEVNASMGRIVASPTAGSCGILPSTLITIKEIYNLTDNQIINSLFTASAVGMVIANIFSIAGSTGGCQAECGVATCMAAAATTELLGGDTNQIQNAIAISIKNIEGLVCDPVCGLVECPCIKRNASGAINAILATDMALAGLVSIIPVDECILAMKQVGEIMDDRLKETAKGGLAITDTAKELQKKIFS